MRDRIAVIFMTLSVVSTLALGGAVIHDLGRKNTTTVRSAAGGASAADQTTADDTGSVTGDTTSGAATGTVTNSGSAAPSSSSRAATSSQAAALSNRQVAVANGVITVGGIYDETGAFDATVERDTVRAYFDTVNAAGGVNGYKFQLVECDSGYDPSKAHACSDYLISKKVLAVVGWTSVSGEQPETPYLTSKGIPVIGGLGVPSEFESPYSFPTSTAFETAGTAMGNHAKDLGIHAPGIIVVNVNFIKPVEKALQTALHKNGITEKSTDEVEATKTSYTDTVTKLRSENVDSIIAALDPFSYVRLFEAMDSQRYHVKVFALGLDKKSAEKHYGQNLNDAESLTPMREPDTHMSEPEMAAYYNAVQKYFPNQVEALDVYTQIQWTAAKTFVEAIRRMGRTTVNAKTLVDSLNSIKGFQTGFTPPLTYAAGNHDPDRCFQWIRNQQNTWQTYSDWTCF